MTKFQKQMLTIAAAGALTAVTALPAMAFENEFHGMFQVRTYLTNFDQGSSGQINPTRNHKANNFTDQRTRLMYVAKASDDLKLVTQFEFNTSWGDSLSGGDIDTDEKNLVVKHAYLDFNMGKPLNVKVGQLPYVDTIGGLLVNADLPMALVTYKTGGYTLGLGYSRFNDLTGQEYKGQYAADLYAIDNTYAFNKDTKVGFSYYLNADNASATSVKKVNTLALSGATKVGALDLSAFVAMQAGHYRSGATRTSYHGWAANTLAKMKVGSGTAKAGILFASGNNQKGTGHNNGWQALSAGGTTANATAVQNTYNNASMMILVRDLSTTASTTANYMRNPITNIALLHMGYDAQLTEKFNLNGNVGMAWVPASHYLNGNSATYAANPNGSDYMGTEMNLEAGYKLYKNLTLKAQGAYVVLGGAYKNTVAGYVAGTTATPANPWTTRLSANYSF